MKLLSAAIPMPLSSRALKFRIALGCSVCGLLMSTMGTPLTKNTSAPSAKLPEITTPLSKPPRFCAVRDRTAGVARLVMLTEVMLLEKSATIAVLPTSATPRASPVATVPRSTSADRLLTSTSLSPALPAATAARLRVGSSSTFHAVPPTPIEPAWIIAPGLATLTMYRLEPPVT